MANWDDERAPHSVRVADAPYRSGGDDVAYARRGVATFGAAPTGERTFTDKVRAFVDRYGWRAYALPVLAVVTVVSLATAGTEAVKTAAGPVAERPGRAEPPAAPGNIALKSDQPGAGAQNQVLSPDALPPGAEYTPKGTGVFRVLPGTGPVVGTGNLIRYSIDVENGIGGIDLGQFATQVQTVLADARSWAGHGNLALQRVDSGHIDLHVTLTSSLTVRTICGYDIPTETSCYAQAGSVTGIDVNRVILNNARWVRGDANYVGDLEAYRTYMINHEVGHGLGHMHSHSCLPEGLAPVMMQQTLGLKSAVTGKMCAANPWPYPPGVRGTPGKEEPDTSGNMVRY